MSDTRDWNAEAIDDLRTEVARLEAALAERARVPDRVAVAGAIYKRRMGLDLDKVSTAIRDEWLNVADAAIAIMRGETP